MFPCWGVIFVTSRNTNDLSCPPSPPALLLFPCLHTLRFNDTCERNFWARRIPTLLQSRQKWESRKEPVFLIGQIKQCSSAWAPDLLQWGAYMIFPEKRYFLSLHNLWPKFRRDFLKKWCFELETAEHSILCFYILCWNKLARSHFISLHSVLAKADFHFVLSLPPPSI